MTTATTGHFYFTYSCGQGARHEKFALLNHSGEVAQKETTWPRLSSLLSLLFSTALSALGRVQNCCWSQRARSRTSARRDDVMLSVVHKAASPRLGLSRPSPPTRSAAPASTSTGESRFLKSQIRETGNKGPGRSA